MRGGRPSAVGANSADLLRGDIVVISCGGHTTVLLIKGQNDCNEYGSFDFLQAI